MSQLLEKDRCAYISRKLLYVSLKELIQTGRLGPVQLGMSKAEIETSLGMPDDVGETSRKRELVALSYSDAAFDKPFRLTP
jgi:hypothetical protein